MEDQDIKKRFTYYVPSEDQTRRYVELRAAYLQLALKINELCPDSREKSVALTELETSQFWANASIARNG